jgi:hypothetical protein
LLKEHSHIGFNEIRKIKVSRIIVRSAEVIDSLIFDYNLETDRGSISATGNKHGGDDGGGEEIIVDLSNQQLTGINGKYGSSCHGFVIIKYLNIRTNQRDYEFGTNNPNDTYFNLSVPGIFFGRGASYLDALGSLQIEEVTQTLNLEATKKCCLCCSRRTQRVCCFNGLTCSRNCSGCNSSFSWRTCCVSRNYSCC